MRKEVRLNKRSVCALIICVVFASFVAAICVLNAFVPVKYLSAYLVKRVKNEEDTLRVTYIDVGFGDCSLIELPDGKTVLIDGGDGSYPYFKPVLKLLNSRGIDKIDYLICTSIRKEHCGGLSEIFKYKQVGKAFVPYFSNTHFNKEYSSFCTALEKYETDKTYACAGEGFIGDNGEYFLTFISPSSKDNPEGEYAALNREPTPTNIENASAIVWFEYKNLAFTFLSDARGTALDRAAENYGFSAMLNQPYVNFKGRAVILEKCVFTTVAGHGGETSSSSEWYDLLKPEGAVVSVGKNYAGYPSVEALSNVYNHCSLLYTEYDGTVTVTVKDGKYVVDKEK